ncbi:TlpA family protein disulfide reductase [Mucilaginibacter xinganensis]|nr:TlpA disulfide reductase family protein [Mucilaginibacter xinganensis]
MIFKISAFLLLILGITTKVNAQKIEIDLKASDTLLVQNVSNQYNDTSMVAHAPYIKYPHWSLRRMAYYSLQARYENLPDNPVRKKLFKEFVERYQLDTSYLIKQKIPENYVYLFTAIDSSGNKHVIIDANNNHDFKDDREYIFNSKKELKPVFYADIKYFDGQRILKATVPLQIDAFDNIFPDDHYKSDVEKKLDVMINVLLVKKTGDIKLNNQLFKFNISNYDELHPKSHFIINIQKMPFNKGNNNNYEYKSSDTLEIAGNRYTIASLQDNKLVMNDLGKTTDYHAETGTPAPAFAGDDLKSKAQFSLRAQKGKYVLIDFWGSWCVPCIKLIPEVTELHYKYQQEIQFVSVAYDKSGDIAKVQKLITDNNMNWVQLLDDRNVKNGIADKYKVNEFPTSILIDPNGKVVYRGIGKEGLKDLIAFYNLKPGTTK